jgi:flagellar biosynthesis regulator FlaF
VKDWMDTQSRFSTWIVEDSNKFISYYQEIRIHRQLSQARTPKQDSMAKCKNIFFMEKAWSMMIKTQNLNQLQVEPMKTTTFE